MDFEFKSSYLGSENCLFSILEHLELLECILIKFAGQVEAGNSQFRDGLVN